tara:strand:- start:471 stop:797 length:327 start_codon:yes stop_codon:yes gene_type:complete
MAVTIDPRPTYFGDRLIVTGSFTGGSATETIDLTSLFSTVDAYILNSEPTPQTVDSADAVSGDGSDEVVLNLMPAASIDTARTTITVFEPFAGGNVGPGTFLAIGRRS